jgi:hypothetical protein
MQAKWYQGNKEVLVNFEWNNQNFCVLFNVKGCGIYQILYSNEKNQ